MREQYLRFSAATSVQALRPLNLSDVTLRGSPVVRVGGALAAGTERELVPEDYSGSGSMADFRHRLTGVSLVQRKEDLLRRVLRLLHRSLALPRKEPGSTLLRLKLRLKYRRAVGSRIEALETRSDSPARVTPSTRWLLR